MTSDEDVGVEEQNDAPNSSEKSYIEEGIPPKKRGKKSLRMRRGQYEIRIILFFYPATLLFEEAIMGTMPV